MRVSFNRKLTVLAVAAALITGTGVPTAGAEPNTQGSAPACEVAGAKPVDNPNFFEGTPLPAQHDVNLANRRVVVQTFGEEVTTLVQHLECIEGVVTIVDTPATDRSLIRLDVAEGRDTQGHFFEFTLSYTGNKRRVQFIQTNQSVAAGQTSQANNPDFARYPDGSNRYTTMRAYTTGRHLNWVSADLYIREFGRTVFTVPVQTTAADSPKLWPKDRQF